MGDGDWMESAAMDYGERVEESMVLEIYQTLVEVNLPFRRPQVAFRGYAGVTDKLALPANRDGCMHHA